MSSYSGMKAIVIGLASSGVAAARLLRGKGAIVDVTDSKPRELLEERIVSLPERTGLYLGGHVGVSLDQYSLAVISPGVPWDSPFAKTVRDAGIEMISEIELASRHISAPIIAVTGSNGKSTTTTLIGRILEKQGKEVFIGGNLGNPLSNAADHNYDWVVAEVSSFQLEGIKTFRPRISVITNITADHLDRHGNIENYARLKARVFENQSDGDTVIINDNDSGTTFLRQKSSVRTLRFGSKLNKEQGGAWVEDEAEYGAIPGGGSIKIFELKDLLIKGPHNVENTLAATLVGLAAGAGPEVIAEAICSFRGLPHRMELVGEVNGVKFYNDSKGTNVDATLKSLAGFDGDVALIAGGSSKGGDFGPLAEEITKRAKGVALIGETAPQIEKALGDYSPKVTVKTMEGAVAAAASWLSSGDSVLLSPACASFDMYKNFEDRGDTFRRAVAALEKR
ncbi:MAG: UDP-N-acetylmuramoyl-L-alanine--D-glutamate ligase [Nitrospinota bacterium]|nr:UDP-N-acetylmuramoyl-L-alanine--D-glutamate ligase [Nitrospinota bacterium]